MPSLSVTLPDATYSELAKQAKKEKQTPNKIAAEIIADFFSPRETS